MNCYSKLGFIAAFCFLSGNAFSQPLPEGFSYLKSIAPSIEVELRYGTQDNFMGRVVNGYQNPRAVVTTKAGQQLQKAQALFVDYGLGIRVFDAYRPQRAVNDFINWMRFPADTLMKQTYYPQVSKASLIKEGYIAFQSGHSHGSTVDITLVHLSGAQKGTALDMGSSWDFFGEPSHFHYPNLTPLQRKNRMLLRSVMEQCGFKPYDKEWWHFTLVDEPFPDQYFDFVPE